MRRPLVVGVSAGAAFLVALGALAATTSNLVPVANGTYQDFTANPNKHDVHYQMVDEALCDKKTSVYSLTDGARESFRLDLSSIPNGSTIKKISIFPCARDVRGQDIDPAIFNVFFRYIDGTTITQSADTGNYLVFDTKNYNNYSQTDFTGLSLSKATSTRLEIGVVLTDAGFAKGGPLGVDVSRLSAVVEY